MKVYILDEGGYDEFNPRIFSTKEKAVEHYITKTINYYEKGIPDLIASIESGRYSNVEHGRSVVKRYEEQLNLLKSGSVKFYPVYEREVE